MNYYKAGNVHIGYALVIGLAFVAGSYFGSKYALKLPEYKVKFIFGLLMLYMALHMLWNAGIKWWTDQAR
jgi:uncharacterized protein